MSSHTTSLDSGWPRWAIVLMRTIDWASRLFLIAAVLYLSTIVFAGLRLVLAQPSRPLSNNPISSLDSTTQAIDAITSWTSAGQWQFSKDDGSASSAQVDSLPHLLLMPKESRCIASRRGEKDQPLVELFTTNSTQAALTHFWESQGLTVVPLLSDEPQEFPGYCIKTSTTQLLVWIVRRERSPHQLTIACSLSNSLPH